MRFGLSFVMVSISLSRLIAAGPPENLKLGIYGRSEQNIYRYYGGLGKGNFYTQRVSNGYSLGLLAHASVNYLMNAGISFGLSEASYSPNMLLNDNTIYSANLRLWQFDFWGELKLGKNESRGCRLILGGEMMFSDYKREIWAKETTSEPYPTWPQNRFMPRLGLGYEYTYKKKWTIQPNAGFRFAFVNKVGYDYTLNQFYAGLNLAYKLKSW